MLTGQNLNRVTVVRDKHDKHWMLPGGKIDKRDTSPLHAARREFFEETGSQLPNTKPALAFIYHGHTAIYLIATKQKISTTVAANNETDAIYFPQVKNLQNEEFSKKMGPLKYYAKNSLYAIFSAATAQITRQKHLL